MKCKKPGTDQGLTLEIFANGLPLSEYNLPGSTPMDAETVQCFIPVSNGDELTVKGNFNGTCLHGAFDVLLDGSLLADRRIESKDGSPTCWNRRLVIEKFLDEPVAQGQYVDCTIGTNPISLDEFSIVTDGTELGVGTLAVIVSLNQRAEDVYEHAYVSKTPGAWQDLDPEETATGGIAPTHQFGLKSTNEPVGNGRRITHTRRFGETRFGHKPWAKMVFFYRSRMAIEQGGCVPRPDVYVDLEADEVGAFTPAKPKSKAKLKATMTTETDDGEEGDEIAVGRKYKVSAVKTSARPLQEAATRYDQDMGRDIERRPSGGLFVTPDPVDGTTGTDSPLSEIVVRRPLSPMAHDSDSGVAGDDEIGHVGPDINGYASGADQVASEENEDEVRIKTEPVARPKSATTHTTTKPVISTSSSPSANPAASLKHPLPRDSMSRGSTPSKKTRISELQAKKAEMFAANQKKLERKLTAEKQLDEDRKRRAAEEDELLREIAELEKEGMELDEATEQIEKVREMENGDVETT